MIKVLSISEIKLKSINNKYATSSFKLSTEYIQLKRILYFNLKKIRPLLTPPYRVDIFVKTYIDIDNTLKPILDTLQSTCIENDRDVLAMHVYKLKRKKGHNSALDIFVSSISEDEIKDKFKEMEEGLNDYSVGT